MRGAGPCSHLFHIEADAHTERKAVRRTAWFQNFSDDHLLRPRPEAAWKRWNFHASLGIPLPGTGFTAKLTRGLYAERIRAR